MATYRGCSRVIVDIALTSPATDNSRRQDTRRLAQHHAAVGHRTALPAGMNDQRVDVQLGNLRMVADHVRKPQEDVDDRIDVRGRGAAEAVENLEGLDRADHALGRNLPHGGQAEGDVLEDLDHRAAQAEHHQRSEAGVAAGAQDHLDALGGHLLDEDALDLRPRHVLQHVFVDLGKSGAGLVGAHHLEDHAAGVELVNHVGRHDFHGQRPADLGRPAWPLRRACRRRRSSAAAGDSTRTTAGTRPGPCSSCPCRPRSSR